MIEKDVETQVNPSPEPTGEGVPAIRDSKGQFQKGSGNLPGNRFGPGNNLGGRKPNAGLTILEWVNIYASSDDIQKVHRVAKAGKRGRGALSKDEKAFRKGLTPAQIMGAQIVVGAMKEGYASSGKRLGSDDLERILDRTDGKPVQRVEINVDDERTKAEQASAALLSTPQGMALALKLAKMNEQAVLQQRKLVENTAPPT